MDQDCWTTLSQSEGTSHEFIDVATCFLVFSLCAAWAQIQIKQIVGLIQEQESTTEM